jgi:hypothetical protein
MRIKIAFLSIFLVLITIVPLHSQEMKKLGQCGFTFLAVEVGARATGMGEAFTVIGTGADAIFYNPAGIAEMNSGRIDLTVSRTEWLAGSSINALGLVCNLGVFGNVGVSCITTDYGDIYGTSFDPTIEAGYVEHGLLDDIGAYAAGISYARKLTDKFQIGGNARYAFEHLSSSPIDSALTDTNKVSTISYDMGTIFYPGFKSFRLGMSVRNFSTEIKYYEDDFQLPLTFCVAVGMDILDLFGEYSDHSLLVDLEVVHPRDYSRRLHLGAEYAYKGLLMLRLGYKANYDEEGLCAGLGVHYRGVKIDYSYCTFGVFDYVNRVSCGVSF